MLGSLGSSKRSVVAVLAVVGFVLVATPTSAAPRRTAATNVYVTNTTANPVPVKVSGTPNVSVTNTPNVHVTNTAAVTISPTGNAVNVGTPTVKLDPAHNTVQVSGPIQVQQPTPFHAYKFVTAPSSAGGKSCVTFDLPAGTHDRVDHVTVTTYNDASAVVYLRYFVKEGDSTSRILALRVLTNAIGSDPVVNSRSGTLDWGANVAGGNVFDVQLGELHSLNACIQSSTGNSATGTMTLDGVTE